MSELIAALTRGLAGLPPVETGPPTGPVSPRLDEALEERAGESAMRAFLRSAQSPVEPAPLPVPDLEQGARGGGTSMPSDPLLEDLAWLAGVPDQHNSHWRGRRSPTGNVDQLGSEALTAHLADVLGATIDNGRGTR